MRKTKVTGRPWVCFGSVWGRLWVGFGSVLGRFWHDFGTVLGWFWDVFGIIWGRFWVGFGGVLWVFQKKTIFVLENGRPGSRQLAKAAGPLPQGGARMRADEREVLGPPSWTR